MLGDLIKTIVLLGLCILFSVLASISIKQAAGLLKDGFAFREIFSNFMFWVGGASYAAAFLAYIYTLRIVPLSLAQPVITAGVSVFTVLLAVYIFRESLSVLNWMGLLLVCVGIFLLFVGRY